MAGKQAKTLTRQQIVAALRRARHSRYPQRDRVIILLSFKAGLRAGEIAKLNWPMVLDADGRIAELISRGRALGTAAVVPFNQPQPWCAATPVRQRRQSR
jgi:integrase